MKAYKYEVVVIDFEGYGSKEYRTLIEQHRHFNGHVLDEKEADIGEWTDDHMLNKRSTTPQQIRALFETPPVCTCKHTPCICVEFETPAEEISRMRDEYLRLKGLLNRIASIEDKMVGGDWDEIEEARAIARLA